MNKKISMKINVGSRTQVEVSQMLYCISDSNYTKVFLNDGQMILSSTTLGKIEERLGTLKQLIRPNRSFLININYAKYHSEKNLLLLNNGHQVKVSRRRKPLIISYFENI